MESFLKKGKIDSSKSSDVSENTQIVSNEKKSIPTPWVEKYRPKVVTDIADQHEVVKVMDEAVKHGNFPNLLLYGPPGTGKTSIILAAAKQIFGSMYKERIMELNASDERGIQVIREKVKTFAQLSATSMQLSDRKCPAYKIVILDEADSMTTAAQSALRRTIEKYVKSTRFCLICNYVSRIIEPLSSRCMKFRFKSLQRQSIYDRLTEICTSENVRCNRQALDIIVEHCDGDLRKAITSLQSCVNFAGRESEVQLNDALEITGAIPKHMLDNFVEICSAKNFSELQVFVDDFILESYSVAKFFDQFSDYITAATTVKDEQRAKICEKLGLCSYRLTDGGSAYIQLMDLGCSFCLCF